jgi:hypothetical protein
VEPVVQRAGGADRHQVLAALRPYHVRVAPLVHRVLLGAASVVNVSTLTTRSWPHEQGAIRSFTSKITNVGGGGGEG